ncbi:hypothetical protein A3A14_01640 [Candidatus Daviesbacteria bacterium RIFCSPLOWO2_01_FULL_43_38]|uniref:DUF5652 domain-containing protein n=2 Tax=Candidatus Daviesiibacteriota TaxID=1752718 RepID=A0A1F5K2V7_9BACT|nr:MAG: hypothetical protein UV41_C0060G0004 [Candidatus Daviesbacteria bacterium GW2011_GWA2_42_7]OGE19592.1 MAG: hypothetical protein A2874_03700 [Candidatus Daviesbacteria bacterium RIFCSPHIGHO2_01_FULL_43_17]OGE35272.1 MAG: hypothetical protein A3E45_03835 [Candidatus Daviesbacteria bacterium RIFCSPHIGHO2_12_FULL_43_11]OGE63392.1 MAG: hypothetical protein A3A14_01640 [Candidatus Daviesbacteria bacterium RIFCSPLOWO2_01_FULL_43_38]OGE69238.1 MAG: hypothetical protein A3J21_01805 [Candidatus D
MITPDLSSPIWVLPLVVWDLVWKGVGLWKASRNNQRYWFIALLLFNTLGILPIIYIKFFQKKHPESETWELGILWDKLKKVFGV